MEETAKQLAIALFMAIVANRLTEGLIVPLFEKFKIDRLWLLYVSWLVASGIVSLSCVNLFAPYIPNQLTGQILTAVVAGGGANLLADLFKPKAVKVLP